MLFNSFEFAVFLPIVFLLYWFVFNKSMRLQNLFVVAVSYVFYSWWDWKFLFLIAFTSLCSFASGILIEKYRENRAKARTISALNIIINLLILGTFKYYNFFVTAFADAFLGGNTDGLLIKIILPVGISFYTFQALSYSIDVYKKKIEATHDVVQFFAFVSFFPQLVAGPIERATNLLPQFAKPRTFEYEKAVDGLRQMLWGFFKKIVVADNCAVYVNSIFADYQTQSGSTLLLGAIFFTVQIYCDFSGCSDIAIGTARLFGINLMRNFNFPYFSRDIAEFWRRWHISLTTWFRDYVYIPLGGSRVSKWKVVRNTFIIFLVSGFWHGANWTFIAWGAYHAVLFLPLILLGKNRKYTNTIAEGRFLPSIKEFGQMLLTFFLAVIGWIIFRAETIGQAVDYIGRIFNRSLFSVPKFPESAIELQTSIYFVASIPIMFGAEWLLRERQYGLDIRIKQRWVRYIIYYILLIMIIFFQGKNESFIYFQF